MMLGDILEASYKGVTGSAKVIGLNPSRGLAMMEFIGGPLDGEKFEVNTDRETGEDYE